MRILPYKGVSLVEVVVGAAIITLVIFSLVAAYLTYLRAGLGNVGRLQAAHLAEEGIEVMKLFRDNSWTTMVSPLTPGNAYYLATSSGTWTTSATPSQTLTKFERIVRVYSVLRDTNGVIVSSGGTDDPGTRKVTVTVSWPTASGVSTRVLSTYLMNLFNN